MNSSLRPFAILAVFALAALAGCTGSSKGANSPPVADLAVSAGSAANVFLLDGSKSADPDGDALTYHWNWALGNTSTKEAKIEVEFPDIVAKGSANYIVSLVVRDADGGASVAIGNVVFGKGENKAPTPAIIEAPRWVKPGTDVILDAGVTTDPENDALSYEWIWGPKGTYDPKVMNMANACEEANDVLATFSTGCLAQGESYNITFGQQGTFNIHCHPHPWMKSRITVDGSAPAESKVYPIANFGYPEPMTIGVGSTLRFVNLDPDPAEHTATIEDWTPGTKSGGTTPVFKQNLAEGEYVVRLIVTDATGARATQTWGLKASTDAPANPQTLEHIADVPLAPNQKWSGPYNLTYPAVITATLTWDDPTGSAFVGTIRVGRVDPDGTFTEQKTCVAKVEQGLESEPAAVTMNCTLKADKYVFQVEAARDGSPGFLPVGWEFTATGIVQTNPGFGDSSSTDGHAHQH